MIAQSTAEALAEIFPEKRVFFLALNGRESLDYVREETESIDKLKSRLESRLLEAEELKAHCRSIKNLFILGGISNEEDERYYLPELASHLMDVAGQCFDIIVVDSGNRLDNGLALGALSFDADRYFVLTQQETLLTRWEKRKPLYERLGIMPRAYILNHYMDKDIYPLEYIARRLGADRTDFHKVRFSYDGRQAEIERKTLWVSSETAFMTDINCLAESMTGGALGVMDGRKRKKKWRSFI
jgi:hypothetical protein